MGQSTQVAPPQQMPIGIVAEHPRPKKIDQARLAMCQSLLDAIHLCIHLSRLPHYSIAERLGIDRGHWTRMMQGQAHFPTNKLQMLMEVCGNYAPMQWLAQATGFELYEDARARRREELQRELRMLEAVA